MNVAPARARSLVEGASPVLALERVGDVSQLLHRKTRTKVPRSACDVSQLLDEAAFGGGCGDWPLIAS